MSPRTLGPQLVLVHFCQRYLPLCGTCGGPTLAGCASLRAPGGDCTTVRRVLSLCGIGAEIRAPTAERTMPNDQTPVRTDATLELFEAAAVAAVRLATPSTISPLGC